MKFWAGRRFEWHVIFYLFCQAAPNTSIDENNMCKDMVVVNMSNTGNGSNVGSTDVNNKCLCLEGVHSDVQSSINNSYSNTNSLDSICYDSASDLDFGFSNTYSEVSKSCFGNWLINVAHITQIFPEQIFFIEIVWQISKQIEHKLNSKACCEMECTSVTIIHWLR